MSTEIKSNAELLSKIKILEIKLKAEEKLNDELIAINKKIAKHNTESASYVVQVKKENERLQSVERKGVFFEYPVDEKSTRMEFVPMLGDLSQFKRIKAQPTRLMYTFTFEQMEKWLNDLAEIMRGKKEDMLHVDENELK